LLTLEGLASSLAIDWQLPLVLFANFTNLYGVEAKATWRNFVLLQAEVAAQFLHLSISEPKVHCWLLHFSALLRSRKGCVALKIQLVDLMDQH